MSRKGRKVIGRHRPMVYTFMNSQRLLDGSKITW